MTRASAPPFLAGSWPRPLTFDAGETNLPIVHARTKRNTPSRALEPSRLRRLSPGISRGHETCVAVPHQFHRQPARDEDISTGGVSRAPRPRPVVSFSPIPYGIWSQLPRGSYRLSGPLRIAGTEASPVDLTDLPAQLMPEEKG